LGCSLGGFLKLQGGGPDDFLHGGCCNLRPATRARSCHASQFHRHTQLQMTGLTFEIQHIGGEAHVGLSCHYTISQKKAPDKSDAFFVKGFETQRSD
jgi:hypothetical protein